VRTTRFQVDRLRRLLRPRHADEFLPRWRWTPEAVAVAGEMQGLLQAAGAPDFGPVGRFLAHPVYGHRLCDLAGRLLGLLADANREGTA
jgi:hypothetical protein